MKNLLSIIALFIAIGTYAQKNPVKGVVDNSAKHRSEVMAHTIEKVCAVDDKADMSELLRVCFEYEVAKEMLESKSTNTGKLEKLDEKLDKDLKSVIGNANLNTYKDWKTANAQVEYK